MAASSQPVPRNGSLAVLVAKHVIVGMMVRKNDVDTGYGAETPLEGGRETACPESLFVVDREGVLIGVMLAFDVLEILGCCEPEDG